MNNEEMHKRLRLTTGKASLYKIKSNCNVLTDVLCEMQEENEQLHSIIKEVREILKYHLSKPSQTKDGWHIDIWNSESINKLDEYLEILDKVGDKE